MRIETQKKCCTVSPYKLHAGVRFCGRHAATFNRFIKHAFIFMMMIACAKIFGASDSLTHYTNIALQNNLGVRSAHTQYLATLEKVLQITSFEDLQFDAGIFIPPMELSHGRQLAQFQVMQMFPWFGTRRAAKNETEHMAQMAYQEYREACDQLRLDVYTQWVTLVRLNGQLKIYESMRELLQPLEELAGTSLSSGVQDGMGNILRLQIEINQINSDIENTLLEIKTQSAMFNALLNRAAESVLQIPDSLVKTDFVFDEANIMQLVREQNPMLLMIDAEESALVAKTEMDRRMGYPMFGVGLQYMLIGKLDNAHGGDNGKDMFMPMVSVRVPIFRGRHRARLRENELLVRAQDEKRADMLVMFEAQIHGIKNELDNAERKITLYERQTELVGALHRLALQEFVSGRGDLSLVILSQRQLLDYELTRLNAVADYNIIAARLQKIVSSSNIKERGSNE